jgi:guanosine-3',5'-bis(diphosphate) 3'-pyrophosphohydrolase
MEPLYEPEYEENSPFGKNLENDLKVLLDECDRVLVDYDKNLVKNSFYYCAEKHVNVLRKSGLPYYTHPLNVALILLKDFPYSDAESVAACMLHDTIEDVKGVLKSSIEEGFGLEVAEMVDAVTKIRHEKTQALHTKASTSRKLFLALVKDVRVILVKLADRLHNMRTLHYLKAEKQYDIAKETLNFYTPLAHRLGLNKIKMELENLSFYYSDKDIYIDIRDKLRSKRREFLTYINQFVNLIDTSLDSHNLSHTITVVHKHEYEIYGMMQDGKELSDIDNFYSIVVILDSNEVSECYRAHGILANAFNSINFTDYISNSKVDWYKALNTELIGPDGKRVEIIIRTEEMEKMAEEGFASRYSFALGRKSALSFTEDEIESWGSWMQDIIESSPENAQQIIWNSIKTNLYDGDLTIFSKDGSQTKLPKGSTIVDYAFSLSNDIGFHCISAKVNGVLKNLNYELNTGDQIELIKSPNSLPKPEWQKFVTSHNAVVQLHNYFKNLPVTDKNQNLVKENFDVELNLIGEDKEGMLYKITTALGNNMMKKINLDSKGELFEGSILINVKNKAELNLVFLNLLQIDGIKSVEKVK